MVINLPAAVLNTTTTGYTASAPFSEGVHNAVYRAGMRFAFLRFRHVWTCATSVGSRYDQKSLALVNATTTTLSAGLVGHPVTHLAILWAPPFIAERLQVTFGALLATIRRLNINAAATGPLALAT
jgi:hypothetical protein